MGTPFMSEIKIVAFNFAPKGWALCNGQFLPINQNQALFSLLGTTYGGNGQTTFALPNLQGNVPIHMGDGHILGEAGGETAHTITMQEMPTHLHLFQGTSTTGALNVTTNNILGVSQAPIYGQPQSLATINPQSVTSIGGSQPHNNMMPYLVLNFIIALQGVFPSRN
jgi:microcystin-dependent protein